MPKSNGHFGTPNTNEQIDGITPGHLVYAYVKGRHICVRCRVRWVDANVLVCAVCETAIIGAKARQQRRAKHPKWAKDKNPTQVEIVIARDLSGTGLNIVMQSDIGKLLGVHKLLAVDIRDARKGTVKLTKFRDSESEQTGAA